MDLYRQNDLYLKISMHRTSEGQDGKCDKFSSGSVLFLSRPLSEGWPHRGRTFSVYLYPLSF